MRQGPERHRSTGLNRREFLGVGALPLAAGLAAKDFGAKSTGTEHKMKTMQSAQATVRVGLVGAGGIVQRAQLPNFRQIPGCEVVAVANRSLASSQRAFPTLFDFGSPPQVPEAFRPTCHIFYGMRVMEIDDGLPKWSGHKDKSPLL